MRFFHQKSGLSGGETMEIDAEEIVPGDPMALPKVIISPQMGAG